MVVEQKTMSCARLARELSRRLPGIHGAHATWCAHVDPFDLFIDADEAADHVRFMVPVAIADSRDHELLLVLLSANFDRALDAHYAVHDGLVWCLFAHALTSLDANDIGHAIDAVLRLAANTGTTFSCARPRPSDTLGVEGGVA
jgi:hypothetical protein